MGTDSTAKNLTPAPPPAKCFKDASRDCDETCMAFHQPGHVVKARWEFCRLLVDAEKNNRHLKVLAESMNVICTYIDDERRRGQPPPPTVR